MLLPRWDNVTSFFGVGVGIGIEIILMILDLSRQPGWALPTI
jgi:hypothetical protein